MRQWDKEVLTENSLTRSKSFDTYEEACAFLRDLKAEYEAKMVKTSADKQQEIPSGKRMAAE